MSDSVTQLLDRWSHGDAVALEQLMPLVEGELRRIARLHLRKERSGHTLQPTALVNEAYLKFAHQRQVRFQGRAHFLATAAGLMRLILVDYARRRNYAKRGGGEMAIPLDEAVHGADDRAPALVAVDDALTALAQLDPRKARVAEMRFFGGLTVEETAEALGVSIVTIERDWRLARAWLQRELS